LKEEQLLFISLKNGVKKVMGVMEIGIYFLHFFVGGVYGRPTIDSKDNLFGGVSTSHVF